MILLLDNFDSFTYNLVDYFEQLGVRCEVVRNNVDLEIIIKKEYAGIVLSPGPSRPAESGILLEVIKHYHNKIPMLGICLGHQAICEFFGGKIEKAIKPMHGKISSIESVNDPIFFELPDSFNVVRYHSLVCQLTSDIPLKTIARTREKELMAMRHIFLPIWGLQFHPEAALTEYGIDMLRNWLVECGITT